MENCRRAFLPRRKLPQNCAIRYFFPSWRISLHLAQCESPQQAYGTGLLLRYVVVDAFTSLTVRLKNSTYISGKTSPSPLLKADF
jgi:hypothetical protein